MYLILHGKVRVYKTMNSEQIELALFSSNTFFGEMSLLLESLRTATVKAVEDTTLLEISKEGLLVKIQQDPQFALRIITTMARRLKESHSIITNLEGAKRSLEIMYGVPQH